MKDDVVREFHRLFYEGGLQENDGRGLHAQTRYHGIEAHKCPFDLWIFQEILFDVRPQLVIELGTYLCGTTLFLAHQLEALGAGSVVSIDCREFSRPAHARIHYLLGETTAPEVIAAVTDMASRITGPVLVIHDADHRFAQVLQDLTVYAPFVTPGSYLIVEDTNVNGHPVLANWGPGPLEAVDQFLAAHPEFERDSTREKFLMTYNPGGYLKRTHSGSRRTDANLTGLTYCSQNQPTNPKSTAVPSEVDMSSFPINLDNIVGILGRFCCTVVDVGARFGAGDAWWRLHPLAKLVGFDPDPEECKRLSRLASPERPELYVPCALGRQNETVRFHETSEPGCSSLYPPRVELIERYPVLSCMQPIRESEIELVSLDDWAARTQTNDIRFMKLDTQGSELNILRGSEGVLAGCVGLEIEVEFSELYQGQPLFADVDLFLRKRGFLLWRLGDLCHYSEVTSEAVTCHEAAYFGGRNVVTEAGNGRLFWANAVYFRDYQALSPSQENARRLMILACLLSARGDHAAAVACYRRSEDMKRTVIVTD